MSSEALSLVRLPPGYSWGERSGDYRVILKDGRKLCRVGGLIAKMNSKGMQGEVCRAIMRGEVERSREPKA